MIKYAKVIDEQKKLVDVLTYENERVAKKEKMVKMEVEQGFDSNWYVKGFAPKEPIQNIAKKLEVDIEKINLSQIRDIAIILTSKDSEKVREAEEYLKTKQIEKEKIINSIKNLGRI